jgi:hypothetical protein
MDAIDFDSKLLNERPAGPQEAAAIATDATYRLVHP